jgi:hypothetical protein
MRTALATLAVLLSARAARAQDFGIDWIDRVTHEFQAGRGPLEPRALAYTATGGVAYYHDSNIFLEEDNEDSDSVVIPFVRARLDYAEQHFAAAADLLLDYKWYSDEDDANDSEQRFFGRMQYADAGVSADLALLARNESDPVNVIFSDRVERVIFDAYPRISLDVTEVFAVEVGGAVQVVRYGDDLIADSSDNENFRGELTLVYRSAWGVDLLAQGGVLAIRYTDEEDPTGVPLAPPDVDGFYARGGLRGEVFPALEVEALAGYTTAESDDFDLAGGATADGKEHSTADVSLRARYEATETLTLTADYVRAIAFAGDVDPFQVINRALGIAEYQVTPEVSVRGRVQYEQSHSALGIERDYVSLSGAASYKALEYLALNGGVTWRSGEVDGAVAQKQDFDDVIFHVGVAATY